MQAITAYLWNKQSPINGIGVERLHEKFTAENGSADRVLIAFDGVVSRIQRVNDNEFNDEEKMFMNGLTARGLSHREAIAETWAEKVRGEYEADERQTGQEQASSEQLRADIDYLAVMTGVNLDV